MARKWLEGGRGQVGRDPVRMKKTPAREAGQEASYRLGSVVGGAEMGGGLGHRQLLGTDGLSGSPSWDGAVPCALKSQVASRALGLPAGCWEGAYTAFYTWS